MENEALISAEVICAQHHITHNFLESLGNYGLVRITRVESTAYVPCEEMRRLERLIRLHHDLDLDVDALDMVTGLLQRIEGLQRELIAVKGKLRFYEQ